MPAAILSSAVRTCLGNGEATFRALLDGRDGLGPLRCGAPERLNVSRGYHVLDDPERPFRATHWLARCVAEAVAASGLRLDEHRTAAIVGTGLRELHEVERSREVPAERLHFESALREVAPGLESVLTVSAACSAGGHALALALDLLELGDAEIVIVGGADGMTESMLSMIGRVADRPADRIRPFDVERQGVLLGEGAAALVLAGEGRGGGLGRVLSTGLSCDAFHETAPDAAGIRRAMEDALRRARREPGDVELVFAHGTGTSLNDPTEATVLSGLLPGAAVTALKGAIGHTSGASALHSLDVALRCLREGVVPPIAGLRRPIPEAEALRLVRDRAIPASARLAQVDAFGFGGVNAVTLLEAAA